MFGNHDEDKDNDRPLSEDEDRLDLEGVIRLIILKEGQFAPDAIYPFISYVLVTEPGQESKKLYVRKVYTSVSDNPEELTRIVTEAFIHQRNNVGGGETAPRVKVIRRNKGTLDVEYVLGIETYTLNRQLRTQLRKTTSGTGKTKGYEALARAREPLDELLTIRRALIQAQLVRLAEFQQNPYVPQASDGAVITDNPDLKAYYTASLNDIFEGMAIPEEIIPKVIRVIVDHLPDSDKNSVRYIDMYPRNHAIKTGKLGTDLNSIRKMIADYHGTNEDHWTTEKERAFHFMYRKLKHFDYNRVTRIAFDLEDFMHATDDPGVSLTLSEQWQYYKIFLAVRQAIKDRGESETLSNNDKKRLETLEDKLKQMDDFADTEIRQLAPDFPLDRGYFLAMKAYRNLRKATLIERSYLPKYEERIADAKEKIIATMSPETRTLHAAEVESFREKGNLEFLQFMTQYLSDARIPDVGLYATGIRYNPQLVNPKFYQLFEGDNVSEQQENSLQFIVALSRYVHAKSRYNEYISDRRNHLEHAEEAIKELCTYKVTSSSRRKLRIHSSGATYMIRLAKKRGIKLVRTITHNGRERKNCELRDPNNYYELHQELNTVGTGNKEDFRRVLELSLLRYAIRKKCEDRSYARK